MERFMKILHSLWYACLHLGHVRIVWFSMYAKQPCASNLVKGQNAAVVGMTSSKDKAGPELEEAPAAALWRSDVWDHFGFCATYGGGGKKTATVRNTCCSC